MAHVPAVRRSVAILRHLGGSLRPVTAGALARAEGIPRSSLYELLSVLEELDLVTKVENGYMLGLGVADLNSARAKHTSLQQVARSIVHDAAESAGGSALLAVLRGWETVYLVKEAGKSAPRTVTEVGIRMPGYLTATGRAILSEMNRKQVLAIFSSEIVFAQRTGHGPSTLRELNSELAAVRKRGYAVEYGEITEGIWTVAAPVVDAAGRPVASVGISLPNSELSEQREHDISELARQAAQRLTARLR